MSFTQTEANVKIHKIFVRRELRNVWDNVSLNEEKERSLLLVTS